MKESLVEKFSVGRVKTDWTGRNNDLVHNLWNKAIYKWLFEEEYHILFIFF